MFICNVVKMHSYTDFGIVCFGDFLKTSYYYYYYYYYYYFLNLGRSSRGGRQKLILEIIALMVNHPSGSHQQSSRAAG